MRAQFYVLTLFLGVVLTVHLVMNGKVGAAISNAAGRERPVLVYRSRSPRSSSA